MMIHGHRPMRGMMPPPPPPRPFMRWRRPYIPGGGCCGCGGCGGCLMTVIGVAVFAMMMLTYFFY